MCGRHTLVDPARLAGSYPQYRLEEFSQSRLRTPRYNVASGTGQINARWETVATKPTFREAFRKRRCIVFAGGFDEWKNRKPLRFIMKDDAPFAFAGIWEPAGGDGSTCAILTCAPNELVAGTHDRMPVIACVVAFEQRAGSIDGSALVFVT